MGFGYLTIGYLLSSVLYLTAQALGVGSLASLAGFALMFWGLTTLQKYEITFSFARWSSAVCAVLSVYDLIVDTSVLFHFDLPILSAAVKSAFLWTGFVCEIALLVAALYAVRRLAAGVGLPSLSAAAFRDTVFVGMYAALYILCNLPLFEGIRPYLILSMQLFNLVVIILVLLLFLQCTKNICREGDEEVTPKRSRFGFVNRMADAYEKTHDRMTDQARADGEAFMRRREEKRKQKKNRKKK